jgi:hypothetical protein
MLTATLQQQARQQAMQAQAIRLAVWGEPEAFSDYLARLSGQVRPDEDDRPAALAAFGLRAD